jgi:hypothetical protein
VLKENIANSKEVVAMPAAVAELIAPFNNKIMSRMITKTKNEERRMKNEE